MVAPLSDPTAGYEDEAEAANPKDLEIMYRFSGMKLLNILFAEKGDSNTKPLPPPNAPNPKIANAVGVEPNATQPMLQTSQSNVMQQPKIQAPIEEKVFTDGDNIYKVTSDGMFKKDWETLDSSSYRLMKAKGDGTMTEMKNDSIIVQTKQWKKMASEKIEE